MNSTIGRPRALTDAQVAEVMAWHRTHKTLVQVAREFGVSTKTIRNAIERSGVYKQPSPELRTEVLRARRELIRSWDRPLLLRRLREPPPQVCDCSLS
jgi:hypothetical protein